MAETEQQAQTGVPYLKTGFALWGLGLIGAFLVLPYVATLEGKVLADKAARMHLPVQEVLALSVVELAVLLAVAVFAGLWAARKLGLGAPLIAAIVSRGPFPKNAAATFLIAVAAGVAAGFVIILLDSRIFAAIPAIANVIKSAKSAGLQPPPWQGFLASFYGALDEEILMRLGLLSLIALAFRTIARWRGADRSAALPSGVFWAANIVVAVLFGVGHLPAAAAIAPLTTIFAVRIVALNAVGGLMFGALYRRYGLECGMAAHFAADIVLHVLA